MARTEQKAARDACKQHIANAVAGVAIPELDGWMRSQSDASLEIVRKIASAAYRAGIFDSSGKKDHPDECDPPAPDHIVDTGDLPPPESGLSPIERS